MKSSGFDAGYNGSQRCGVEVPLNFNAKIAGYNADAGVHA